MSNEPEFPNPIRLRGRLFWRRIELENYKRELISFAAGGTVSRGEATPDTIETLVPSDQVVKEFGFGRRTLGRRIAGRSATAGA